MLTEEKARGIGAGIQQFPRKCREGRGYKITRELTQTLLKTEPFTQETRHEPKRRKVANRLKNEKRLQLKSLTLWMT
jgi:hypothetical protein